MPEEPIVVAGAGIAGLALAVALTRDGRRCRVLDERPALGSSGGAITLWPNALAALDHLGLGDDVRRVGREVPAGEVRSYDGRLLRRVAADRFVQALGGPLLAVRRGDLVEVLHAQVAPGSVEVGVGVTGYHLDASRARVRVDCLDQRTGVRSAVDASALVGADGYRSAVARVLGGGLAERYAGYPAWRGIAPLGGLAGVELWGRGQEFGVVPLDDDSCSWFATVEEPAAGSSPDGELAHLRRAFAGWPDPVARVLAATAEDQITRNDVLDRASPRAWSDGPVTVVGDAAHAMRPHLGQGGCQALVDVAVLASRLRATPDPATAFREYAAARRRPALRVARMSRTVGRFANGPTLLHRALPLLPEAVFLRRLAAVGGRKAFRV